MEIENTILSEVTQTQKDEYGVYHTTSYVVHKESNLGPYIY